MSHNIRRHDIDALRFLVFSLLIVYHTALLYMDGWNFHMHSSYTTDALNMPLVFINRWRMEIVFLISGVSCAMMTQTSRGAFLWRRTKRLLLPLLFGMAIIIPIQPYCEGVSNGLVEPGYGQFLLHYFGGHAWPAGNVAQYLPPQTGGRPSVYIDADPDRAAWLDDAAVRSQGAVFVWEAESGQVLETPAASPPADWSKRFPAMQVQPQTEIAVRRFGREFKVRVGWGILPPEPQAKTP